MESFVKKVSRPTSTPEEKSKKIVIKKTTKKVSSVNVKQVIKVGGPSNTIDKDTVLGTKGYSINKSEFTEEEVLQLKDELMAKPHTQGGFSVSTVVKKFPIFRESTTRLYMPRYFGEAKFGTAKRMKVSSGDEINVPTKNNTVTVSGEVQQEGIININKPINAKIAIESVGGFTNNSIKREVYVEYQNGLRKVTKNFLFFKFYPRVLPGSKVVVPERDENRDKTSVAEIVGYTTSLVSIIALIKSF